MLDHRVDVVAVTDDLVAVHKPATMPVHPPGQYRKNTVLGVLAANDGTSGTLPVHRLDRNVSGLLLGRNARTASALRRRWRREVKVGNRLNGVRGGAAGVTAGRRAGRRIAKTYVALVDAARSGGKVAVVRRRLGRAGRWRRRRRQGVTTERLADGAVRVVVSAPLAYDPAAGVTTCVTSVTSASDTKRQRNAKDAVTVFASRTRPYLR